MEIISGFNDKIACVPPSVKVPEKVHHGEDKGRGGFTVLAAVQKLLPLKVVYGNLEKGIRPGDTVYVRGSRIAEKWAREPVQVDGGAEVVIVSLVDVELVSRLVLEKALPPRPEPTPAPGPGMVHG